MSSSRTSRSPVLPVKKSGARDDDTGGRGPENVTEQALAKPFFGHIFSAILPETPIASVSLLSKEPDPPSVDGKQIVLDLRVELGTGEQIDVEMQTQPRPQLRERALYYWTR